MSALSSDAATLSHSWPDGLDATVTAGYLALALGLPILGYVCMALDIRAYLRSLRRALVLVSHFQLEMPDWVCRDTPRCIQALGLVLPCTTDDVLAAYRRKVKVLHPDRGGNRQEFLRLQRHFEQAIGLVTKE
jgi:hypothetical protein